MPQVFLRRGNSHLLLLLARQLHLLPLLLHLRGRQLLLLVVGGQELLPQADQLGDHRGELMFLFCQALWSTWGRTARRRESGVKSGIDNNTVKTWKRCVYLGVHSSWNNNQDYREAVVCKENCSGLLLYTAKYRKITSAHSHRSKRTMCPTLQCTMETAAAPISRLALRKSQGRPRPAGVRYSVAGVHSFNGEGGNESFPTRRQRAAGNCHTEVADWNRKRWNAVQNAPEQHSDDTHERDISIGTTQRFPSLPVWLLHRPNRLIPLWSHMSAQCVMERAAERHCALPLPNQC